jgi:hypothetical protein
VINNVNCIRVRYDKLEYRVIDKCVAVNFFVNVNSNKSNLSQQTDYKVDHLTFGNFPRSYYYVKRVLQVVRLLTNIIVKERVYSIFEYKVHIILMQRDACRVTTRPAFRGTFPKTYIKSRVPHFT